MTDLRASTQLASELLTRCAALGYRLAVAESLTGGLLAATLIAVPGASQVVTGGVVAYDTHLKHTLLGVDAQVLATQGPVCKTVAEHMAQGVRTACATPAGTPEIGLATTGVAGPDPDPLTGQPAGTVWIGWSVNGEVGATRLQLTGERQTIRAETVTAILRQLLVNLSHDHSSS